MKYKVVLTATKDTKPTYVLTKTHKMAKGFAGIKSLELLEAYDLLVTEGLKALGYDPEMFK